MISDWQKLLERIEVQRDSLTRATEEEILAFEKRTGIILPAGYKEYCQVFGAGEIGNGVIRIRIPYRLFGCGERWLDSYTENEIEPLEEQDVEIMEDDELNNYRTVKKLLSSALVFGGNSKAGCFFWDLNTYSDEDKSYDIYAMSHEDYESRKLGRDFFEFICNYCLGMKRYDDLPWSLALNDEEIAWIFH